MKRPLALAVALVALAAIPVGAAAGLSDWNGDVEGGDFMAFNEKNGGKAVKQFEWSGVPIDCEVPTKPSSGAIEQAMKVEDKRFKGTDDEGDYKEKVKGRFVSNHSAKGTLRIVGEIGGSACDTGKRPWEASDL